ncbi:MAG: ABC transporter ATP-binding protein [Christensenellaceae bacterium]|jgi:putative spermidine/putrescine transport system ATP-binding protein|nr:ABC transporter ATP-binding protein [Christensenellaceae bacterium]
MNRLELKNASIAYGRQPILQAIDLQIQEGEFFSLLGRSGCGKTTLIKAVAGLLPLYAGQLLLNGQDAGNLPPEKRRASVLFQDVRLFSHLTAEDNVAFGLRMQGMGREQRRQQANAMLERVGLGGLGQRAVDTLSGGQQQRVALARAVLPGPSILLLDEPFSSLDMELRTAMRALVKSLHSHMRLTTLLVTHDVGEAMLLSNRVAIIDDGRICCCAAPRDLLGDPKAAPYLSAWKDEIRAQSNLLGE